MARAPWTCKGAVLMLVSCVWVHSAYAQSLDQQQLSSQQDLEQEKAAAVYAVSRASNEFARDLYQMVRAEPGNLLVSPLSVAALLALAWLGAAGRTAQQLSTALHLPPHDQQVALGYRGLMQSLQFQDGKLVLDIASKVFVRSGLRLRDDFRRDAANAFLADAEEVDFSRAQQAAAVVNLWVRDRTRGKIEELVQPEALSAATSLLLANAIYFKGTWVTQFDPERTALKPFRTPATANGVPRNVSLMTTRGDFPYANLHELDAKAVRLPYVGGRVSMLVLLPNAVEGLPKLEETMAKTDVAKVLAALQTEEVYVWLPRFSLRTDLTLNDALVQLGLSSLFTSSADFSGIAGRGAFMSRVLQKARLDVYEEGSEAAAASGGIFLLSAGLYNFFRADHPFLFYILDDNTGTVLFQGRYSEPE